MKVLLINPPYQTITSNFGVGHQIPLGLLMIGGPLLDAGHEVRLLDAECRRSSLRAIVREVRRWDPDVVMTGHAGSTPAHPTCIRMLRAIKDGSPGVITVYGGVYPTYHADRILAEEPAVDLIVRGEGEATTADLVHALQSRGIAVGSHLEQVPGLAYRAGGEVVLTDARPPIPDLDRWRVGWELIEDWDDYGCFGLGRAAIVQFSRGCPHRCTYCGQHGFWVKWRHRDPARLADEIEWLHRTHGVNFITLADENPTTLQDRWRSFLEEMVARKLPVRFFATIRATDIVRDRDLLPLYREAGILYVLMGVESTDDEVLRQIKKGSTTREDFRACRLLKEHGIFSILGHIVGFGEEDRSTFRTALRQLRLYDGDHLNAMYVTPHAWTPFGQEVRGTPGRPARPVEVGLPASSAGAGEPASLATVPGGEVAGTPLPPGSGAAPGDPPGAGPGATTSALLGLPAQRARVARRGLRVPAPDLLRTHARDPRRSGNAVPSAADFRGGCHEGGSCERVGDRVDCSTPRLIARRRGGSR